MNIYSFYDNFTVEDKHVFFSIEDTIRLCQKDLEDRDVYIDLWQEIASLVINSTSDNYTISTIQEFATHKYQIMIAIQMKNQLPITRINGKRFKIKIDKKNIEITVNCTKTYRSNHM